MSKNGLSSYLWILFLLIFASLGIINTSAGDFVTFIPHASPQEIWSRYGTYAASNRKDGYGWTPLMIAAGSHNDVEAAAALLRAGARIDAVSIEGWTALMFAAAFNPNSQVTRILLEHGADPNARTIDAWSAMTTAARFLEQQTFIRDITAGREAVPEYRGLTPLMLAARFSSSPEVTVSLVEAGAEINAIDEYHLSPLLYASRYNENDEIITVLLDLGADPYHQCYNGYDYKYYLNN